MPAKKKATPRKRAGAAPKRTATTVESTTTAPEGTTTAPEGNDLLESIGRGVVSPILNSPKRRAAMGLPEKEDERGPYMIELNVLFHGGLAEADRKLKDLWPKLFKRSSERTVDLPPKPISISKSYLAVELSVREWRQLIEYDKEMAGNDDRRRLIYKLWPDFKVKPLIDRSVATIKADAAYKAFSANGSGITWAVVDSGIDGTHPHFGSPDEPLKSVLHHPDVAELHRDFSNGADIDAQSGTAGKRRRRAALVDDFGHGTHVAGIISGSLPADSQEVREGARKRTRRTTYEVFEQVFESNTDGSRRPPRLPHHRSVPEASSLRGVAPGCLLVSLKVMDAAGNCRVSDVMRALAYVREQLNSAPKLLRVHGVNISLGYDFDAQMFACGQSPLCVEVDRLVRSGVVVVVAAGNTGYGEVAAQARIAQVGLSNTINDPGNSELAITVGATHRDAPHTYGVSFFSSKGPTGDGRLKPDMVAPGERITSCASAGKCSRLGITASPGSATYVDDSGTSLAAPHVSGAIAAFLSIRREFIQRPEDVKRLFLSSATTLGRERYFEGNGLVDLMRAIQSV
jgi:serine protease AprX